MNIVKAARRAAEDAKVKEYLESLEGYERYPSEGPVVTIVGGDPPKYTYPIDRASQHHSWLLFTEVDLHTEIDVVGDGVIPRTIPRTIGSALLYSPGGLEVADAISYNQTDLGMSGTYLRDAINARGLTGAMVEQALSDAQGFAAAVTENFFGGKEGGADPGLVAKVLRASRLNGTGPGSGILSAIRAQANPHTHSIFQGVGIRTFTFAFTMVPDSEEEQAECRKIIKFFRTAAYPAFGNFGLADDVAWRFPSVFNIEQLFRDPKTGTLKANTDANGNFIGHKYLRCHLTDVAVKFDPESTMAMRFDMNFPAYSLSLTFQEEKTLSKADILEGY